MIFRNQKNPIYFLLKTAITGGYNIEMQGVSNLKFLKFSHQSSANFSLREEIQNKTIPNLELIDDKLNMKEEQETPTC